MLVGLAVIALNPHTRTQTEAFRPSQVLLLVDTSTSMQQAATDPRDADSSAVPTRSAAVESLLAEGELIETLQNQHVVDLYTFDEELGPLAGRFPTRYVPPGTASPAAVDDAVSSDSPDVDWPSLLQPRGLSTRLGDALDALLAEAKSPTLSGVVLFTDGVNNAGRGLERARERARKQGVPLIAVGVGSTRPPVNASIVRIIAPTDVQKGDAFEIAAFVQASHLSGQSAAVELLQRHAEEEDFTVIAREDIVLPDEDDVVELSFERSTLEAGEFEYQVRIDVPGVVETRREDNAGIRQVNVFDRPLKVLVVVDLWLQTGEVGISQEANDLLFRFPEKREDLFQYDVLLAFDPDWTAISDEQQKWIEEWVSNEGGGVLFVAGDVYTPYLAAGADNEGLAAIQRLLPVVLDEVGLQLGARSRADTAYPVQLTQEGAAAEFLRLRDSAEDAPESVDPWQEFRGVFRSYPTRGRKAGTTVYAEFTDPLSRGADGQPVLIGGLRYGQGTTLFLGSPEMWRLRAVDEDVFDRFWIKLVRKVAEGRSKRGLQRGMFILEGAEFDVGQSVPVRARVLTPQFEPLEEDTISIELIDPNGRPTIPPSHIVPQSTDRVTTEVQVQLPRLEVAQLTQDQRALQTLTDGTGGRYLPIESADRSYVSESQKEFSHMQKDRERRHLDELIGKVRGRIRRYLFLEGLASLVTLVCVLFWVTWACDVLYFEVRKLELPLWFRMGCTIVMACLVTWGILRALVFPALRGMRATSLALLLERQFPQLDDRLITAIELGSSSASSAPPLYQSMLSRTVGEASQMMESLDLSRLFDFAPLRQAVVAAVVMLVSVGLFGATHAQGMGRWVEAYLLAKPDYWEPYRQSALSVHVVAQPGDRRRDFDDRGVYKHPRGADLEVIAEALPETTPPSEVILQFLGFGGAGTTRGRATMTQVGESRFRHSIARIVDNHNLWLQGGDYVNREPFRVVVVDPPQVTDVRLHCDYPSYTGLDSVEDVPVVVAGTQVSLPMETRFELVATANKPLKRVHVRSPRLEVSWGREASEDVEADAPIEVLIRDDENGDVRALHLADSPAIGISEDDRRTFHIAFRITAGADEELALLTDNAEWPLPLPADTPLQIYLEDEDDIYSMDPAMVTINGIRDLDPVLDVQLSGVRSSITRTATIPFEGRLTDDYGVERGWFTYRIDESEEAEERAFKRPPTGQKEFRLDGTPEAPPAVEQFNVLPLELREGQKLAIVLHAEDGDRLNGPHHGRSNVFAFEIVSKEELLGQLFDREVNLRLRFEQMRSEISQLKDDLGERVGATASEGAETDEAARSQQLTLLAAAERSLHQLRKNHTESRAIEVSFEDLRTEMVNNRVDTADLLSRIDDGILRPLGILNTEDFLETDRRLGVFRLVAERGGDTGPAIEESIAAIDIVLERIDRILAEMRDRGNFNELIQELQQIIDRQKSLLDETEKKESRRSVPKPGNVANNGRVGMWLAHPRVNRDLPVSGSASQGCERVSLQPKGFAKMAAHVIRHRQVDRHQVKSIRRSPRPMRSQPEKTAMRHILSHIAIALGLVLVWTLAVPGADPPKEESAPQGPDLSQRQEQLYRDYERFEKALYQLAEQTRLKDPERAELLYRARGSSQEQRLLSNMQRISELLKNEEPQYGAASDRQKAIVAELQTILKLLQSLDSRDRVKTEIARLEAILTDTNRLIARQKDVRAETQRGRDASQLQGDQQDVADEASELAEKIDEQDLERAREEEERDGESGKPQEGESGKSQDPKSQDPMSEDSKSKSGEQSSESKPQESGSESSEGEQKPSSPMPSSPMPSQPMPSQPMPSTPMPPQGAQNEQPPAESAAPEEQQTAGREELEQARQEMQQALDELKQQNKDEATAEQDAAIARLEEMKAELEEILRQLREEEKEMYLTLLEARFQQMLRRQTGINSETLRLHTIPQKEWTGRHRDTVVGLSRDQGDNVLEAEKALTLLKDEGSSVAFPEAVEQMQRNMEVVRERLASQDVGETTQLLEQLIVETLEEMIFALQKEMEKIREQKEQQQGQPPGQPGDPALVDQLAELKMIRSLQNQVNRLTRQLGLEIEGEQATDPQQKKLIEDLARRQERIQEATYDLS
ncbi:Uncharacterized protein SCF082_LOCUS48922, partial [Durusdinium trenchii]